MPNLLAHHLLIKRFALKEAELRSPFTNADDFLTGNRDYLTIGAQGPDPLFYMGVVPTHGLHLISANYRVGNHIHKTDAKRYFRLLVEQVYGIEPYNSSNRPQKQFMAFVLGQFSHYLLDRECHPYILYESGFDKETGSIKGKYHYEHAHFESEIDFALCKQYKYDYFLANPWEILPENNRVLEDINENFVPVLERFQGKKLPKKYYVNAVQNMRSLVAYMNKGSDMRAKMLSKSISLKGIRLPKEVQGDVLNERRTLWLNPVTGEEHHESFLELHSKAFRLLEQLYTDILRYGFNYDTFAHYIDGNSYYGTPTKKPFVYMKEDK